MSYPTLVQVLVIEDDIKTKSVYERIFKGQSERFSLAPPCYAFCFTDASAYLSQDRIFHLVILDLRLPEAFGLPPESGVDLGMRALGEAIGRAGYPIPALLVVSGHVEKTDQGQLRATLDANFHYGRVVVKGDLEQLTVEIGRGIEEVNRYVSVGLHLRDGGERRYPTITPAEEDVLRRFVLQQQ